MIRNTNFTELMDAVEGPQRLGNVHYWDGYGFHFYAMLRPVNRIAEAKSKRAMEYAERVLKNYTQAASAASRYYGSECRILEHQGWVIHFYIHTNKRERIVEFAKLLSTLVEGRVMESFDEVTLQFHMAAEYGRSLLIAVDSATSEEAAKSCVSLGPCANDPAKKIGDSTDKTTRPLWIRIKDEGPWDVEDCSVDVSSVELLCERLMPKDSQKFLGAKRAGDYGTIAVCRAQTLKDVLTESDDGYLESYCFRADMDGFTKAVKKAFESVENKSNPNAVTELANDFVGYMTSANNWQAEDKAINILPYPWAGDCCNMLAWPNYGEDFGMTDFESSQKFFPVLVFNDWNGFVKKNRLAFARLSRTWREAHGKSKWVCCISGGVIYPFDVTTSDRKFRVMVGWPVGVSHTGVNLEKNEPDSLVLHKEDLEPLEKTRKSKFKTCKGSNEYSYATQEDLAGAAKAGVSHAATAFGATSYGGVKLVASRPYGGSDMA